MLDSEEMQLQSDDDRNDKDIATSSILKRDLRTRLSDITNMQQRSLIVNSTQASRESLQKVQKENILLRKLLDEQNKMTELRKLEMQNLRVTLKNLCTQNWQLAKANTQMLAELNSGKDKLKEQQHKHGCEMALLKTKNMELEEKLKKQASRILAEAELCDADRISEHCDDEVPVACQQTNSCRKQSNVSRRHPSRRSYDLSASHKQVLKKEKSERKRKKRCSSCKPSEEDSFVLEDEKFPVMVQNETIDSDIQSSIPDGVLEADNVGCDKHTFQNGTREMQTLSCGWSFQGPCERPSSPIQNCDEIELQRRSKIFEIKDSIQTDGIPHISDEVAKLQCSPMCLLPSFTDDGGESAKSITCEETVSLIDDKHVRHLPRRTTVEKIISYKEKPLNMKERSEEGKPRNHKRTSVRRASVDQISYEKTVKGIKHKPSIQTPFQQSSSLLSSIHTSDGQARVKEERFHFEAQDDCRRVQRAAAQKVVCYKEMPLNVKIRRETA